MSPVAFFSSRIWSLNKAAFSNSRLLAAVSISSSNWRRVSVTSKLPPASLMTLAALAPGRWMARLSSMARVTLLGVMLCSWL